MFLSIAYFQYIPNFYKSKLENLQYFWYNKAGKNSSSSEQVQLPP
jgi:hypothetical protein